MVEERPTRMLVDTGSAVTIVRESVWREATSELRRRQPLSPVARPVVAANGQSLELCGQTVVLLRVGNLCVQHPVLVVKDITQQFLLGADFLERFGCVIDLRNRSLMAGGRSVPVQLQAQAQRTVCHVSIKETTEIPGYHQVHLHGRLSDPTGPDYTGMFEPLQKFAERHGLFLAHSVSLAHTGHTIVRALNPSPATVTVYKEEKVGLLHPVEETRPGGVHVVEPIAEPPSQPSRDPERLAQAIETLANGAQGLTPLEETHFRTLLQEFADVISVGDLGKTNMVRHTINTGNAEPIHQHPRRLPFHQKEQVHEMLQEMLDSGIIEPATSPWSSPIVLAKKKDGTLRFCVDFRRVNKVTKKDVHPLPRIDDTLDTLSGARWFSTVDLASGYWQVEVDPADREKTAFATPFGLHQFKVMPFGLSNAPSTFQRLMELVLAGLQWSACLVYLDDIIIFSQTVEQHLHRLREVLGRLRDAGLKMKPSKCHFLRKSVSYLGHIISERGVETDPEKTRCVQAWPTPTSCEELRRFMGFASYYRKFVRNFAQIAAPLHSLTEKSRAWCWSTRCEEAFATLKQRLTSAPILAFPHFDQEFILDTDASGEGLGAVLSQVLDGQEHVVAYGSRSLTKAERRYCATRRELLALVWSVRHFRTYLLGRPFLARTDHNALKWLFQFKDPEGQVARWLEILAEFDLTIQHPPGQKHCNADGLSRIPCNQCGQVEPDKLPDGTDLVVSAASTTESNWLSGWNLQELQSAQREDPDLLRLTGWLETKSVPPEFPRFQSRRTQTLWSQRAHLLVKDGVLYRQWEDVPGAGRNKHLQLLIPMDMVPTILRQLHDAPSGGHLGFTKTLEKVRARFYWPGQRRDVEDWCRACQTCASRKSPSRTRRAPLQSETAGFPLQRVAMDVLGPLPQTLSGNKYILVIGDYFTKWMEAFPMPNMEAITVAELLVNSFICRFGTPDQLHTDQGRNFEAKVIKEVCQLLGITKTRTTPYHPQSDGLVERFNRTLLNLLSMAASDNERNWDLQLPKIMLAYRTSVQESTRATPFQLMFGREVRLPVDVMYGNPSPAQTSTSRYALDLRLHLDKSYENVRNHMGLQQRRQKTLYDRRIHGAPFRLDDQVWLHSPAVPKGCAKKLHRPWQGPYRIVKVLSEVLFRIQRKDSPRKRLVVHFNRLKPYYETQASSEPLQSPVVPPPSTVADLRDDDLPLLPLQPLNTRLPQAVEAEQLTLRRSQRPRRPPDRFGDNIYDS